MILFCVSRDLRRCTHTQHMEWRYWQASIAASCRATPNIPYLDQGQQLKWVYSSTMLVNAIRNVKMRIDRNEMERQNKHSIFDGYMFTYRFYNIVQCTDCAIIHITAYVHSSCMWMQQHHLQQAHVRIKTRKICNMAGQTSSGDLWTIHIHTPCLTLAYGTYT